MRTFEFRDDKSAKFWNIDLQGKRFTVCFGRIGTAGQIQEKAFADEAKALKEHDKLIAEKVGKGYLETKSGPAATPAPASVETARGRSRRPARCRGAARPLRPARGADAPCGFGGLAENAWRGQALPPALGGRGRQVRERCPGDESLVDWHSHIRRSMGRRRL